MSAHTVSPGGLALTLALALGCGEGRPTAATLLPKETVMSVATLECPKGTAPISVPTMDAAGHALSPPPLVSEGAGQVCARPDGTLHGPIRATFRDGEVEHVGAYENGQKTGRWTWTDRQGRTGREGEYVAGQEHGIWTEAREGRYDAGKRVGEWTRWYDTTGHKARVMTYVAGVATGLSTRWHDNGQLAEEGALDSAGKRTGH